MDKANLAHHSQPEIIDIRREELDQPLLKLLLDGLESDQQGVQALPTLLLYDGRSNFTVFPRSNLPGEQKLD